MKIHIDIGWWSAYTQLAVSYPSPHFYPAIFIKKEAHNHMKGKIALEEHFAIEATVEDALAYFPNAPFLPELRNKVMDIQKIRLDMMDQSGIEVCVISLNAPAVQAIQSKEKAIEIAKLANDTLAEECAINPKRFAGFAALPMQDPDAAAEELNRCVKDFGFVGALVNGFSQVNIEDSSLYYDLPQYWDFWSEVERLNVPFYLHPRSPLLSQQKSYEGHPWLKAAAWGFSVETGTHALRLIGSGLFDKYPGINIILGHLGELLPVNIWRTSHRVQVDPRGCPAKLPFSDYLMNNFYITTSGNFRLSPVLAAMVEMGSDRIMFATDYPFEVISEAAEWFDNMEIGEIERQKIGRLNAARIFHLDV